MAVSTSGDFIELGKVVPVASHFTSWLILVAS